MCVLHIEVLATNGTDAIHKAKEVAHSLTFHRAAVGAHEQALLQRSGGCARQRENRKKLGQDRATTPRPGSARPRAGQSRGPGAAADFAAGSGTALRYRTGIQALTPGPTAPDALLFAGWMFTGLKLVYRALRSFSAGLPLSAQSRRDHPSARWVIADFAPVALRLRYETRWSCLGDRAFETNHSPVKHTQTSPIDGCSIDADFGLLAGN